MIKLILLFSETKLLFQLFVLKKISESIDLPNVCSTNYVYCKHLGVLGLKIPDYGDISLYKPRKKNIINLRGHKTNT